ncbi:MAG TPA: VWA domain-containing protein [Acidobacteriaceae bacterium]|nr:VWA domain-containing protein [Acidobacteriaceae bacterium]
MRVPCLRISAVATVALLVSQTLLLAGTSWAQQTDQQQNQNQTQNQNQQPSTPPAAGGPGNDNGPIALPRRTVTPAPPPPPPPNIKNPPGLGNLSMRVNVPVVNVDVGVLTEKTHQFIPNLQEDNFRVFENGVPQPIIGFEQVKAPITAVLLLEFASNSWYFIQDMWQAAWSFTQQLEPQDYVAVVTYDMHTNILTDFTQNKSVIQNAIESLQLPTWNETNVFDALYTTLDRLSRIPGRKYIILVGSGIDTFSRIDLDKVLEKIKETPNVTIFTISTGGFARALGGMAGGIPNSIGMLQADNEMQTYARMTGGMWFEPRFQAEFPDIFQQINASIRNQYQLTYRPTDTKMDGTYRRIRIELVDAEGQPLRMENEKHKPVKYLIVARDGYKAQLPVQ